MASDLTSFLSKVQTGSDDKKRRDLIVSKDQQLMDCVKELYIREGFSSLETSSLLNESNIHRYTSADIINVILDFRGVEESEQCSKVTQMVTLLDTSITVIVLSDIDSISLQNQIYHLGAEYVLWDEALHNLTITIASHIDKSNTRRQSIRSAKRVLVIGTKGGVGVSCFSSVLANILAVKARLKVMLVEHDSHAISSDAYLGLKQFKAKQNPGNLALLDIDAAVAESYLYKVQDKLDYVALDSRLVSLQEHTELLYRLSHELSVNYNFVIDSVPVSSFESLKLQEHLDRYHRIYLICEPSVASLRALNAVVRTLAGSNFQTVFNLTRPEKDYLMTTNSAQKRVKDTSGIRFIYDSGLEKQLFQQGISSISNRQYFSPFTAIVKDLTGKDIRSKVTFSLFNKLSPFKK
ncbi:AAA family ATPase [Vibrio sp. SCSIO 43137]|uniref:AAA family ATPase n=1 Tax=Vibrio sp. SCSIO 43137 TaxID=3021011 RepID=UPI002307CCA5|nr:type II secretion protein [Vibrio sp. SCSIO 43137]WCE32558.1 type II secretion protein [Vibrio sp. SCSIO 43137]